MTRLIYTLAVIVLTITPAKADYYLWEDPKTEMTLTFPDAWERQQTRNVSEVLRIVGPSNTANPVCTVSTKKDKRYTIFPSDYGYAVQRTAVSIPFWQDYMIKYDDYTIDRVFDGAGFGRWLASYALGSYMHRDGTAISQRRGIMFASLYYDTLYITECTTYNQSYEEWAPIMRSIIKSIDFKKVYHEHMTGEYANFLNDAEKNFWAQTSSAGTSAY